MSVSLLLRSPETGSIVDIYRIRILFSPRQTIYAFCDMRRENPIGWGWEVFARQDLREELKEWLTFSEKICQFVSDEQFDVLLGRSLAEQFDGVPRVTADDEPVVASGQRAISLEDL